MPLLFPPSVLFLSLFFGFNFVFPSSCSFATQLLYILPFLLYVPLSSFIVRGWKLLDLIGPVIVPPPCQLASLSQLASPFPRIFPSPMTFSLINIVFFLLKVRGWKLQDLIGPVIVPPPFQLASLSQLASPFPLYLGFFWSL